MGKRKSRPKLTGVSVERKDVAGTAARKHKNPWYVLVPCIAAVLVFLPALRFGFVGDDHVQIEYNPQVQSWASLPRLLTTDMWSQNRGVEHEGVFYRPLFSAWLLVFYSIAGASPWLWHLASIILHSLATFFVYTLLIRLTSSEPASSAAAFIFAVHPIHIESVCWISASNEIWFSICSLAALSAFLDATCEGRDSGVSWTSSILWGIALLFKETAIVLVPLFICLVWKNLGRMGGLAERTVATIQKNSKLLLVTIVYVGLRLAVLHHSGLEVGKNTWQQTIYSAPALLAFYLRKLVLPVKLSGFYMDPLSSQPDSKMWLGLLVVATILSALVWLSSRSGLRAIIGSGLTFLPLLPVLGAVRVYHQGNILHDRYLYLPSVGLVVFVALLFRSILEYYPSDLTFLRTLAAGIAISYIALNVTQQRWLMDDEAYYRRALEISPANYLVWDYLGNFHFWQKRSDKGLQEVEYAYQLAPANPNVRFFYARGLYESGRYADAAPILDQLSNEAGFTTKRRSMILLARAEIALRFNHFSEALGLLNQLRTIDDSYPGLHDTLGGLYQLSGKFPEAVAEYKREYEVTGNSKSLEKSRRVVSTQLDK